MKNATLILVVAIALSSCAGGKPKQNTAFSWLSTTNVTPTVSR